MAQKILTKDTFMRSRGTGCPGFPVVVAISTLPVAQHYDERAQLPRLLNFLVSSAAIAEVAFVLFRSVLIRFLGLQETKNGVRLFEKIPGGKENV